MDSSRIFLVINACLHENIIKSIHNYCFGHSTLFSRPGRWPWLPGLTLLTAAASPAPALATPPTAVPNAAPTVARPALPTSARLPATVPGLCLSEHQPLGGAARGRDTPGRREDGPPPSYVWLAGAGGCDATAPPAQTVRLQRPLPPAIVRQLLQQQDVLLERARLLFAGNTQCARLRALAFTLEEIDSAAPAPGARTLYTLRFRSDRGSVARVDARYSRAELTAWNVSCPAS